MACATSAVQAGEQKGNNLPGNNQNGQPRLVFLSLRSNGLASFFSECGNCPDCIARNTGATQSNASTAEDDDILSRLLLSTMLYELTRDRFTTQDSPSTSPRTSQTSSQERSANISSESKLSPRRSRRASGSTQPATLHVSPLAENVSSENTERRRSGQSLSPKKPSSPKDKN